MTQTATDLEIVLPPLGSSGAWLVVLSFLSIVAIVWNYIIFTFMLKGFVLIEPFPINLLFGLFTLPFWVVGLGMLGAVMFGLWGRVRLTLNAHQIRQDYELFGLKRSIPPPSRRRDISKLEITKAYFRKNSDGDLMVVKPQLLIWVGTHKYGVVVSSMLTPQELDWLGQTLSHWLNLPLERERYSTR
ncbi:MAG: hypothetical protein WA902_22035 [Thermosynechococcaceae cyanobacterium]